MISGALRSSRSTWILGALGAIGLHASAVALVAIKAADPEVIDEVGAPAIEVGMVLTSSDSEPTDLPPGPEAEASAESVPVREQKQTSESAEATTTIDTNSASPDEVAAPKPQDHTREMTEASSASNQEARQESAASEATAAPSIPDAPASKQTVAPVQGSGRSDVRIILAWQKRLVAHLDRNKRYPPDPGRGTVKVDLRFTLDRTGRVVSVEVIKSSGSKAFDDAAMAMMRRAEPVPAPPPAIADDGLTFSLPVIFQARNHS